MLEMESKIQLEKLKGKDDWPTWSVGMEMELKA